MTLQRKTWLGGSMAWALWLVVAPLTVARAEPPRDAPALAMIPADAAYFATWLRLGEQWERVSQSKAMAKLRELPMAQELWRQVQKSAEELAGVPAPVLAAWNDPENQELIRLLGDLATKEVFLYCGSGTAEFFSLLNEVNGGVQGARIFQMFGVDSSREQVRALLTALNDSKKLELPNLLLGMRTTQGPIAEKQLKRLESQLNTWLKQAPQLQDRLTRAKLAGADFLVLHVDGKLVPWDSIPLKDFEDTPDEFKELPKKLARLQMSVGLGLKDGYVHLAVGKDLAFIDQLGRGPRLVDRPELKPLADHKDKRLLSLSYVSTALAQSGAWGPKDMADLTNSLMELMEDIDLSEKDQERIKKDVEKFVTELTQRLPQPGARLGFSFLSERGITSYAYDWSKNHGWDGSRPLSLLNHVGGTPILVAAGRSAMDTDWYDFMARWAQTAFGYFEEFGVPELTDDQKEQYKQAKAKLLPLVKRFDAITRTSWLPAMKDGQSAFVLDAKLSSRQWQPLMPESDQPLPILEPAWVHAITDAAKVRQAGTDYRELINDVIKAVSELGGFPIEQTLPEPQTQRVGMGTVYYYPLPEEAAVDSRLSPSVGLSDKVLAFTISREHAVRILTPTPLTMKEGLLAEVGQRPLAGVFLLDWATLVESLQPWAAYGLKQTFAAEPPPETEWAKNLAGQAKTLLSVLQCLRGYVTLTYLEKDAVVSHSEMIFRDLEK